MLSFPRRRSPRAKSASSAPSFALFLPSRQHSTTSIVDEKCCLFQEGGHLGANLPPLDPVSPHFSPPVRIQRHQLLARNAVFSNKEVTSRHICLLRTQFRPFLPSRQHSMTSSSRIYENRTIGLLESTHLKLTQLKQISPRNSAFIHGSLKATLFLVPD